MFTMKVGDAFHLEYAEFYKGFCTIWCIKRTKMGNKSL